MPTKERKVLPEIEIKGKAPGKDPIKKMSDEKRARLSAAIDKRVVSNLSTK